MLRSRSPLPPFAKYAKGGAPAKSGKLQVPPRSPGWHEGELRPDDNVRAARAAGAHFLQCPRGKRLR
jgi:hypothetical protein